MTYFYCNIHYYTDPCKIEPQDSAGKSVVSSQVVWFTV